MKIGLDDVIWIVTDPMPGATLADIFFECSLRRLELQFRGGLRARDNPTVYTIEDETEAKTEAMRRLKLAARS